MQTAPFEILATIFGKLTTFEANNLRSVSRSFSQVGKHIISVRRTFDNAVSMVTGHETYQLHGFDVPEFLSKRDATSYVELMTNLEMLYNAGIKIPDAPKAFASYITLARGDPESRELHLKLTNEIRENIQRWNRTPRSVMFVGTMPEGSSAIHEGMFTELVRNKEVVSTPKLHQHLTYEAFKDFPKDERAIVAWYEELPCVTRYAFDDTELDPHHPMSFRNLSREQYDEALSADYNPDHYDL